MSKNAGLGLTAPPAPAPVVVALSGSPFSRLPGGQRAFVAALRKWLPPGRFRFVSDRKERASARLLLVPANVRPEDVSAMHRALSPDAEVADVYDFLQTHASPDAACDEAAVEALQLAGAPDMAERLKRALARGLTQPPPTPAETAHIQAAARELGFSEAMARNVQKLREERAQRQLERLREPRPVAPRVGGAP